MQRYIRFEDGRWTVRVPTSNGKRKRIGAFDTEEQAIQERDIFLNALIERLEDSISEEQEPEQRVFIQLPTNKQPSLDDYFNEVVTRTAALAPKNNTYSITIKEKKPIAIAFMSDTHIGSPSVDYAALRKDINIIHDTEGMYVAFHGDIIDNWIVGKLLTKQRDQIVPLKSELDFAKKVLNYVKEKILVVVSGNHDLWTLSSSGIDFIDTVFTDINFIYDTDEVVFDLKLLNNECIRIKIRHKWRGSSRDNPTYGIESSWNQTGEFDIGVGGHTHIATLARPFIKNGKKRYAVLTGTYKVDDEYPRELGLSKSYGLGSAAIVIFPDGDMIHFDSLTLAADYLTYVRNK